MAKTASRSGRSSQTKKVRQSLPTVREIIAKDLVWIEYQPVVDLRSQEILGHEAFVRTSVATYAEPPDLIAAAVAQGCVGELGRVLRRLALRGCPDAPLFLNLIPQELDDGLLLDPADPIYNHRQQIYLEITESVPVHYFEMCHDILSRARAQGLFLAVDDFGAGYSNLQYIADLEPKLVKLDREIVSGLTPHSRRFRLIENVVRLCVEMGAEVVAEGLESTSDLAAIIDAGVHYGQGYFLARPAAPPPPVNFPAELRGRAPTHARPRELNLSCVDNTALRPLLDRRRRRVEGPQEVDLNGVLRHLLERANAFVPSAAGTIFLDDPSKKHDERRDNELIFVACFGEQAPKLLGSRLPAHKGIAGRVYSTGRPHMSADPRHDQFFYPGIDEKTRYRTESVLCLPLRLEEQVIGAIQLLNRLHQRDYDEEDLGLLEIFAQTIAASISNAVDTLRAVELAKRDDLSGLFNDRFLHTCLRNVVGDALATERDCAVIFLDLDNFKRVNDSHGHLVGSAVLRETGFLLSRILPGTAQAARYGGDEFVVILPSTDRRTGLEVAESIRRNIAEHVFLEVADNLAPESVPALAIAGVVTCSVGIASLRGDVIPKLASPSLAEAKTKLLELSDQAMYAAKAHGKNRVVGA